MNIRGILLPIYRTLRPVVDTFHLNRIARPIWAKLWKQGSDSLVHTVQNGRKWRLASEVALRGEWLEFTTIEWHEV